MSNRNLFILAGILFGIGLYQKYKHLSQATLIPPLDEVYDKFQPISINSKNTKVASNTTQSQQTTSAVSTNQDSSQQPKIVEKSFDEFFEEHTEPYDTEGNIYITDLSLIDHHIIAHGDVLIGNKDDLEAAQRGEKKLVLAPPDLWDNGVIPYKIDASLDANVAQISRVIMDELSALTNIKFVERTNQEDYIIFQSAPVHCFTYVGKQGGPQGIFLSPRCSYKQVSHELMHTLGFHHEQSRMDRDDHLQILWENIEKKFHSQFRKVPWKHLDINRFPFDYDSIMLYSPTAFSVDDESYTIIKYNGEVYYPSEHLSPQDIDRINALYPVKED